MDPVENLLPATSDPVSVSTRNPKDRPPRHSKKHSSKSPNSMTRLKSSKATSRTRSSSSSEGSEIYLPVTHRHSSSSLRLRAHKQSPSSLCNSLPCRSQSDLAAESQARFLQAAKECAALYGDSITDVLSQRPNSVVFKVSSPATGHHFIIKVVEGSHHLVEADILKQFTYALKNTTLSPPEKYVLDRVPLYYGSWTRGSLVAMRLEFIEGTLLINLIPDLNESRYTPLFLDLIVMLHYLHTTFRIVHRDVKPDNIIVRPSGQIVLLDWESSTPLLPDKKLRDFWGSWAYAAPEVLRHTGYDHTADIWSAGIVLYLLAAKSLPVDCRNVLEVQHRISTLTKPLEVPPYLPISHYIAELIKSLLDPNPSSRAPSAKIIFKLFQLLPPRKSDDLSSPLIRLDSLRSRLRSESAPDVSVSPLRPLPPFESPALVRARTRACPSPKFQIDPK